MKRLTLFSVFLLVCFRLLGQGVAINTDGSAADNSAMLDVSSTTKGMLLPRMTRTQRLSLTPVQGLIVYQTDGVPGFYYYTGSEWELLVNSSVNYYIIDGDNDTKITVEKSGSDDDTIRFYTAGTEYLNIHQGRIDVLNTGNSVFLGEGAGANDDLSDNKNVFVGKYAGTTNDEGFGNVAIGYNSLLSNAGGNGNTAVGYEALKNMNNVNYNTAVGIQALMSNTDGYDNTAMGYRSLYNNTTGHGNVCIGNLAGYNYSGSENTLIGVQAGKGSTGYTYTGNVFIGYSAGMWETGSNKLYIENSDTVKPLIGGDFDADEVYINGKMGIGTSSVTEQLTVNGGVLFGNSTGTNAGTIRWTGSDFEGYNGSAWQSLSSKWTSSGNYVYNSSDSIGIGTSSPLSELDVKGHITISNSDLSVYIGKDAGLNQNSSDYRYNVMVGNGAGKNNESSQNVAIGYNALSDGTTVSSNVAIGYNSLKNNTGWNNTAIGSSSLQNHTSGEGNVAVGMSAGFYLQSGQQNTYLGYEAGHGSSVYNNANGNVFIGYQAGYNETGSNKLYIENSSSSTPLLWGDFDADVVDINGVMGIGTTSPQAQLHIMGGTDATLADSTGYLLIGDQDGTNIVMDDNEIIARNNGALSNLILNYGSGNVGINDPSPSERLSINGSLKMADGNEGNGKIMVSDANGVASWADASTIDDGDWTVSGSNVYRSSGKVGVGTTSPTAKLHLSSAEDVNLLVEADNDNSNENHNPKITLSQDGGLVRGMLGFIGDAGAIYTGSLANAMYLVNNSNYALHFGTDSTIYATLSNEGNFGIGITSPQTKLHIDGGTDASMSDGSGYLLIGDQDGYNMVIDENEIISRNNGASHDLILNYGSGNVAVGDVTSPTAKLHILGSHGYDQLRLNRSYTPTGTSDSNGHTGDIAWDDNYIYVKTTTGWKRAALSTW